MIGRIVGFGNVHGQVVSLHHTWIGMTGFAFAGESFALSRLILFGSRTVGRDAVQAVAIRAGGRINVAFSDGPAVPQERIVFSTMTTDAIFGHSHFPGFVRLGKGMNPGVAIYAGQVLPHRVSVRFIRDSSFPVAA